MIFSKRMQLERMAMTTGGVVTGLVEFEGEAPDNLKHACIQQNNLVYLKKYNIANCIGMDAVRDATGMIVPMGSCGNMSYYYCNCCGNMYYNFMSD